MEPSYAQMMAQQLMSSPMMPQGMGGQNATSPYGANFIMGNQSVDPYLMQQAQKQQPTPYGMLNQSANQVLQQPLAAY